MVLKAYWWHLRAIPDDFIVWLAPRSRIGCGSKMLGNRHLARCIRKNTIRDRIDLNYYLDDSDIRISILDLFECLVQHPSIQSNTTQLHAIADLSSVWHISLRMTNPVWRQMSLGQKTKSDDVPHNNLCNYWKNLMLIMNP